MFVFGGLSERHLSRILKYVATRRFSTVPALDGVLVHCRVTSALNSTVPIYTLRWGKAQLE